MENILDEQELPKKEWFYQKAWNWLVGTCRYHLYYSRFKNWIRDLILEQIDFRISVMNQECFMTGCCVKCGCKTTALQMCFKSCDGDCYPPMMGRGNWEKFKAGIPVTFGKKKWRLLEGKVIKYNL